MSCYFLAQQSGVDEASLSRFVHGSGLSARSLDAIAEVLGLVVTVRELPRGPAIATARAMETSARQAVEMELEL